MRGRGIAATAAVFAIALPGAAQAATGTGADASDPSVAQLERAARSGGPPGQDSVPGAAGVGDPYFPNEGNGGYDVRTYDLTLGYDPATDHLDGLAQDHGAREADAGELPPRPAGARRALREGQRRARRSSAATGRS